MLVGDRASSISSSLMIQASFLTESKLILLLVEEDNDELCPDSTQPYLTLHYYLHLLFKIM